jgi:hypothetical protein
MTILQQRICGLFKSAALSHGSVICTQRDDPLYPARVISVQEEVRMVIVLVIV